MVSILAKFRAGSRLAQEKASKTQDTAAVASSPKPYRHVPTHALSDALAGVPGSYRNADRAKIRENHRRRSAMSVKTSASDVSAPASPPVQPFHPGHLPSSHSSAATAADRARRDRFRLTVDRADGSARPSPLSSVGMRLASPFPFALECLSNTLCLLQSYLPTLARTQLPLSDHHHHRPAIP